jgi:hypothetical protein
MRTWRMPFSTASIAALCSAALTCVLASSASASSATASISRIPLSGTGVPQIRTYIPPNNSDFAQPEFQPQLDSQASPGAYQGEIVNRSLSDSSGSGVSERSHGELGAGRHFGTGFEGLNFFQQRYANGGNQFSVEPPDQGLCVGNGYVVEAVNDVFNVYGVTGQSLLSPNNVGGAVDLNSFFGYPAQFNRTTGDQGPSVTDPSCLYDSATRRFFLVALTLEVVPATGALTGTNHLDIAVSRDSNPTGVWNIYHVDVTQDGSHNPLPANACPCIGDYPHIGADANGFYVTTNSYTLGAGTGFNGAQVYAFSKAQLAAGAASLTMAHFDTYGAVNAPSEAGATQPGFTLWPAQSPGNHSFDSSNGGTEYFLSSNATDEANKPLTGSGGPHTSTHLVVWTLNNTASLNSTSPSLNLSNKLIAVNRYAIPPTMHQPGSGSAPTTATPLGFCHNDVTCNTNFFGIADPFREVVSRPDGNDSRMQQVTYAAGRLWGSLDTALNPDGGRSRAGIAWYIVDPHTATVRRQGYLGAAGRDLTYPAIGVTAEGEGVMAFTASGENLYPSAAFAPISGEGADSWHVVNGGAGAATDDGFTSYKFDVGDPPRTRWGDYGAAAVDGDSIWIASEYIAHACSYADWLVSPRCGNTRGFYGNWSTRITKMTP